MELSSSSLLLLLVPSMAERGEHMSPGSIVLTVITSLSPSVSLAKYAACQETRSANLSVSLVCIQATGQVKKA